MGRHNLSNNMLHECLPKNTPMKQYSQAGLNASPSTKVPCARQDFRTIEVQSEAMSVICFVISDISVLLHY